MTAPLARALALGLLVAPAFGLGWLPELRPTPRTVGLVLAGFAVVVAGAAAPVWWRAAWVALGLQLWVFALPAARRARREDLVRGVALYALVQPGFDIYPQLLRLESAWSAAVSSLVEASTGRSFGASAGLLGFEAVLLFGCVAFAAHLGGTAGRSSKRFGLALAAAHVPPVVAGALLCFAPGFSAPPQLSTEPGTEPWGLAAGFVTAYRPLVAPLFVALLLGAGVAAGLVSRAAPPGRSAASPPARPVRTRGALTTALALSAVLLLGFAGAVGAWIEGPSPRHAGKVVLYEKGFVSWTSPYFGFFGRQSAGMFGNLPRFIESIGLQAEKVAEISGTTLRGATVVFIANPETQLAPEELEALWGFVRGGGHLLLLGDHTWIRGGGNPLNVILEPSEIRFRDDSANFFVGGWSAGYRALVQPLTAGLRPDLNEPAFVVGASLRTGPRARPLVIGRWGYSDAPALADSAGGYLGDLAWSPGEPAGDLTLMATQRLERGRVTVLGDTSGFFNAILMSSHEFVARLFLWAATPRADPAFGLVLLEAVVAGSFGLMLAFAIASRPGLVLAGAVLAAVFGWLGTARQAAWQVPFTKRDLAFVDASALPTPRLATWDDLGVMGLPLNLERYGYQTHFIRTLDPAWLDRAALLVLIAPRAAMAERSVDRLERWVADGGTLLVAAGAEEVAPVRALLERFGLQVRALPLGSVEGESAVSPVQTSESWPIEFLPRPAGAPSVETLLRWRGYPLAVRVARGRGRLVLVADTKFFLNFNLEHGDHAHSGNIDFLGLLLGATHLPFQSHDDGSEPPAAEVP